MQEPWKQQFQNLNEPITPTDELLQRTQQQMAAAKPWVWLPRLQKTMAVVVCACLMFIGAVNFSPAFASAVAKVPVVRELVAAVSFDPSMREAIAHNYVQLVKQHDSENGYQLDVEYLVADKANLTVYYRLQGLELGDDEAYDTYATTPELQDLDGKKLNGYNVSWGNWTDNDDLSTMQFHFMDAALPEQLQLQMTIEKKVTATDEQNADSQQEVAWSRIDSLIADYETPRSDYMPVATLCIPLAIDQNSLFNVQINDLSQTVEICGQKVIIEKAEVYPTQMRIYWQEAADNDSYITSLRFALLGQKQGLGQKQQRWEVISNGISGVGAIGQPRQVWLDSSWFSDEQVYLLQIEAISLLPKENRQVTYDYATNTFTNLPDYIRLKEAVPCDTGLFMEFEVTNTEKITHGSVFGSTYLDSDGVQQEWQQMGSVSAYDKEDEAQGSYHFDNDFIVQNYEHGPITFTLEWAPSQTLEVPVTIPMEEARIEQ